MSSGVEVRRACVAGRMMRHGAVARILGARDAAGEEGESA